MNVTHPSEIVAILFTDIEASARLWEEDRERMSRALADHDQLARAAIEGHRGTVVKMTGDGLHAVFADPVDAVHATLTMQQSLADTTSAQAIALQVRCGLHAGVVERRANDVFGNAVNRAARITAAAHGGQVLLSQAVVELVRDRLPPQVSLRDLGLVRLRDLGAEHVYQIVHPRQRQEFPALRSLEATPNNLPQAVTSFIGRERELADSRSLLAGTRLLTLTGPGGIGKTRLSLQLGADVMDDYPDGVWLVELAAVADVRLVPQAVATVLGVKEEAGRPVTEALVQYVKSRRLLLIVDNCEHLVLACARLAAQLLGSAPHLKILASSREHLHISGESVYTVPGLSVPAPDHAAPLEAMQRYEAIHLFIDRAVAGQPAFRMTDRNATAVANICRRLDGIPLALELAAARVRALSVEMIAARLADRFTLLVGGDRTALPRHQTLRSMIDWSYELLEPKEQVLLQLLSVFESGFTLEAAQALGSLGEIDELETLSLLTQLVEKSLVTLEAEGQRYRLLDTIQHYALERLGTSVRRREAQTGHLRYYVAFAEEATSHLFGPEEAAWLRRLDLEHQNLLSAHRWCASSAECAALDLRLVSAMKHYWLNRGLLTLGHQVAGEALARAEGHGRTAARCRGLLDAGQFCLFMGRYAEARQLLTESLAVAREIGTAARVAASLQQLGTAFLGLGDYASARTHLTEGLALARDFGNKRSLAGALNAMGQLNRMEGELEAAESFYEQMLTLARELGEPELIAIGLLNHAMVAVTRRSSDRVRALLYEVLEIMRETGSKPVGLSALEVSAGLAVIRSDFSRAAYLYGAAEAQTRRTGLHADPADEAFLTPLIGRAHAALGAAAFAAAKEAGGALAYDDAIAETSAWLSSLA